LLVALAVGCGGDESGPPAQPGSSASGSTALAATAPATAATLPDAADRVADLVKRGERIYNVNCIACHHRNPTKDGGLGPAIAGASYELLEARVVRGEYPPGYTPKSDTRLMIPLPHLEPEIEALTVFLAQATAK
jgi:mono/diheme cytochrome c family protein